MFHADVAMNGPGTMLRNFSVKARASCVLKSTSLTFKIFQEGFSKRLIDFLNLDADAVTISFPHCNKANEVDTVIGSIWAGSEYEKLVTDELNSYMAKHGLEVIPKQKSVFILFKVSMTPCGLTTSIRVASAELERVLDLAIEVIHH